MAKSKAPLTPEQAEVKAMKKEKNSQNFIKFVAIVLAFALTFGVVSLGKSTAEKALAEAGQNVVVNGGETNAPADDTYAPSDDTVADDTVADDTTDAPADDTTDAPADDTTDAPAADDAGSAPAAFPLQVHFQDRCSQIRDSPVPASCGRPSVHSPA